jgi:hypothetical protein
MQLALNRTRSAPACMHWPRVAGIALVLFVGATPAWAQGSAECAAASEPRVALTDDESLALAAIEGLMSAAAERAVPTLQRVLAGQQSMLVKRRALFVLAQFEQPQAANTLIDLARGTALPLKCEAIRNIGISGNNKALAVLPEVYATGGAAVRKEVLRALMIANRKTEILQIASAAKTDSEADDAIHTLAAMGATDELRKLGSGQKSSEKSSRKLVQAYAMAGDLQSLRNIATGTGDLAQRVEATRSLGLIGNSAAKETLRSLYSAEPALRDAALQGLLICGDQAGVLALYRKAASAEEKRRLLRQLSIMGGDAALDAIDAALDKAPAKKP